MADPALGEALAAHRSGDADRAQRILEGILAAGREDARTLHLAGEVSAQAGRWHEACGYLERALRVATDAGEIRFSLARAQWRLGLADPARGNATLARARLPGYAPASLLLAIIEASAGNASAAARELEACGASRVADFPARDMTVRAIAAEVDAGRAVFARWRSRPAPVPPPSFTVVICSIDEAKLARARASIVASDPTPVEWIVIRDARSLAEAYNRAIARATGEALLFMHDDVEVLSPGLFEALGRALAVADVAGVAGTCRLAGPTVGWSGQEEARGALAHGSSAAGHYDYSVLNWTDGTVEGMQGLDGCLLASRAGVARALGFDDRTYDGFHCYDLDFTYRASRSGARVAVASEVLVAHASRGSVAGSWEAYARRFLGKFPELAGTPTRQSHFYAARFASAERALAMHREMQGLARLLAGAP